MYVCTYLICVHTCDLHRMSLVAGRFVGSVTTILQSTASGTLLVCICGGHAYVQLVRDGPLCL